MIFQVVIFHPSRIPPDRIMEEISASSRTYGVAAVGRAAVAGLMLPIALGIDLIILPGPQVGVSFRKSPLPNHQHQQWQWLFFLAIIIF